MEAVGHLTGGLAHDFNNLLAVVISALHLLETRGGEVDGQSRRFIDAAKDAAFRASTLTRRLLEFSRQQLHEPVIVSVNTIISGMVDLLQHSIGKRIKLTTHLEEGLWQNYADTNQLESILLNLVVNARDAMHGEGDLIISTANVTYPEGPHVGQDPGQLAAGDYIALSVADNGTGMPPEVVARAFEPFFTTKEPGKGTGLGLSQVYGFVKRFGGDVRIESELGRGTTITLYLRRTIPEEPSS
jgi:signal transduction histidine kinase